MAHARPEFAIFLALIGLLLAIGVPSLQRGNVVLGGLCIVGAAAVVAWIVIGFLRSRG